jgi:hypothetical protein
MFNQLLSWLGLRKPDPLEEQKRRNRETVRILREQREWDLAHPDPDQDAKEEEFIRAMIAAGHMSPDEETTK